jgi:hypothetical protein
VTCTPPAVQLYTNGACDDASACESLQLDAGECQSVTANCTPFAISAGPPALSVQCTPVADADVPPLGWNNDVTVCASDVGHARSDCPADQICQPRPGSGFGPKLCIGISGASGCPQDSPYSVGAVYYEDATDTRQCAACTCGNPSGFGCTATVLEMTDCTTQTGMDDTPFSCKMLAATNSLGMQVVSDDAGTCPPVGGDPQGTATGANPVTICCLP